MKIATIYNGEDKWLAKCALHNFTSATCDEDGPGVFVEILSPILHQLKVSYELIPVARNYSGHCQKNGTWLPRNTTLGKLSNGTYDMIAHPVKPERE